MLVNVPIYLLCIRMSCNVIKPTFCMCAQRRQISLRIHEQGFPYPHKETVHHWLSKMSSEDSDQTARMRRLI